MRIDTGLLTYLADELAEYSDDLEAFWDTIDGETDIMDVVGTLIENLINTEADEEKINYILKKYTERRDAVRSRNAAIKRSIKQILLATGKDKIPHTLATISLRRGAESVAIQNEKEIPSQLCKVTVTPDKTEIKKQLKAGVSIDGAELVYGPQTISIRIR